MVWFWSSLQTMRKNWNLCNITGPTFWPRNSCSSNYARKYDRNKVYVQFSLICTGSRSTFEFPSGVNLSGPSLYCIPWTLGNKCRHSIGLAGATRLTRSDFRLNLLLLKGQRCVFDVSYCDIFRQPRN